VKILLPRRKRRQVPWQNLELTLQNLELTGEKKWNNIADARPTFAWLALMIGFDNLADGQAQAPLPARAIINQEFKPASQTSTTFL